MVRTTRTIVTFKHRFTLGDPDQSYPAGSYSIETDEELLLDVSFPAYRRTATLMQRVSDAAHPRIMPISVIDPEALEAALVLDKNTAPASQP